jgi:ATP-dependent exoDNAse (exonuclease V) alpha subunit
MPREEVSIRILELLGHEPTTGQSKAATLISAYLHEKEKPIFVLKGYAGTGKTTLVSALVKFLPEIRARAMLLAPTGRAAKVLASYSGQRAFTIHKKIYRMASRPDGGFSLGLQKNTHRSTIFIVDEASMIPDSQTSNTSNFFASRNLLDDLIQYVYEGENCRLILIGDSAQLPPVGLDISPALDTNYLKTSYPLIFYNFELKEVVRQKLTSAILENATYIRNKVETGQNMLPIFLKPDQPDLVSISGNELEENLYEAFSNSEGEGTVIITRSNKRANIFNNEIRNRILYRENEISVGDLIMVVKNNYYWLPKDSKAGFIANGDMAEIIRIRATHELYGFRFAEVSVRLLDFAEENDLDVIVMLDTLSSETPALPPNDYQRLYQEVAKDYEDQPSKKKRDEKIKGNPYFNALQIKFAYALTCHKTQGGQWENVFIDAGYLKDDMINTEYLRWLYTAVTRATKKVYLLNFQEVFFEG